MKNTETPKPRSSPRACLGARTPLLSPRLLKVRASGCGVWGSTGSRANVGSVQRPLNTVLILRNPQRSLGNCFGPYIEVKSRGLKVFSG